MSEPRVEAPSWSAASRIAFRFCFIYFVLFCLLTQVLGGLIPIPNLELPDAATLAPVRAIVLWTAKHVFQYSGTVVYSGSGSGDKVFDWTLVFCLLVFAGIATCLWSWLDRRRTNYEFLAKWSRVFLRFAVAGQLFLYGAVKLIPMQMPFPSLVRLVQPFGGFSPMGVLWTSVGAAPGYERFAGGAEIVAGLLLIVPATTMLGALICLADMIQVFALNMTYDIPVKLFSFQMIVMALLLLVPYRARLVRFCLDCAIAAPRRVRLFAGRRGNRIAVAVQIAFGLLLLASQLRNAEEGWRLFGGGAPKTPLYGIWNVDEMSVDGVVRAPLFTDYGRLRRVIFDYPRWMSFERPDDSVGGYRAEFDAKRSTLSLTDPQSQKPSGLLNVQRQSVTSMLLDGKLDQHQVRMQLRLVDRNKFVLIQRGFHWVQDYPFNR